MRKVRILSGKKLLVILSLFIWVIIGLTSAYAADMSEAESILGVAGQMHEGAVIFSFPRSDLKVVIDGDPVVLGVASY